jgi:hypothetical protein
MLHPIVLRNLRRLPVGVLALSLTALLPTTAFATTTSLDANYERDTLNVYRGRTELSWLSDELGRSMLRLAAHGTTSGAGVVKGIPGGERYHAGADIQWIFGFTPLELRLLAGFEDVTKIDSWRAEGKLTLTPESLSGVAITVGGATKWLDGWFTYGIRSSSINSSVGYAGEKDWAEVGAIWDERGAPRQPATALALDLRGNRVASLYGWYSHAFAHWLMVGTSAKWVDSRIDYHQPVSVSNSLVLQYSDYPYPTPHSEGTWAGLLELHLGPAKLKGMWPLFSQGSYRVEDPYTTSPYYYYRGRFMAQAELRASCDAALSERWAMTIEAFALSRPYRSAAWFTGDAWNQFGLNFTLRYNSPKASP